MAIPAVKWSRPNWAFYLIARLPVEDAEDFSIFMLMDFSYNGETVMLAPAKILREQGPGTRSGENRIRELTWTE